MDWIEFIDGLINYIRYSFLLDIPPCCILCSCQLKWYIIQMKTIFDNSGGFLIIEDGFLANRITYTLSFNI